MSAFFSRWLTRKCGPADIFFGYRTPATVNIRDTRLGVAFIAIEVLIFSYVIIYVVVLGQGARQLGQVYGVATVAVAAPDLLYAREPSQLYICAGANSSTLPTDPSGPFYSDSVGISFPSPGYYQVAGSIPAPQLPCLYAGAALVPDPTGADGTFLPSYISVRGENVTAGCAGYPTPECNAWSPINGSAAEYYVPDLRFFLLSIKHGFTSSVGVAASAEEMDGRVADPTGKPIDLCVVYDQHGLACPVQRHLGAGHTDVIPLIALFTAAGIGYLDDEGGGARGGAAGSVLRRSGFVLLVNIDYSNSFLSTSASHGTGRYSDSYVQYTYRVSVAPSLSFSATGYSYAGDFPPTRRQARTAAGVRVIISQTGTIGVFSAFYLLLNLAVSLGLLALGQYIVDFVALYLYPTSAVIRQYKERTTGDLRLVQMVMDKRLARAFEQDPYLMSPEFPDVIRRRIVTNTRAAKAFRRNIEQRAVTYAPDLLHSVAHANEEACPGGALTQSGAVGSQLELRSVPVNSPDDWGERWLRAHSAPPASAASSSAAPPIALGRPSPPPRRTAMRQPFS